MLTLTQIETFILSTISIEIEYDKLFLFQKLVYPPQDYQFHQYYTPILWSMYFLCKQRKYLYLNNEKKTQYRVKIWCGTLVFDLDSLELGLYLYFHSEIVHHMHIACV